MTLSHNNGGSAEQLDLYINQGGDPVPFSLHENQGGTTVPIYERVGDQLSLGADNASDSTSNQAGWTMNTSLPFDGLEVRISGLVGDAGSWPSTALVKDGLDGSTLDSVDISALSPGDTFELWPSSGFDADAFYTVVAENGGSSYGRGRYEETDQYPHTGDEFVVDRGIYSAGGQETQNVRYNFDQATALWD